MAMTGSMNTNACSARLRSGMSGLAGMPGWFGIGNHEIAPRAGVLPHGVAGIGKQDTGARVSASGEDV